MSWIGWLIMVTIAVGFGIGMLTKSITTIVTNVKALKKELKKPDYKKQIKCENSVSRVMRNIKDELFADRVLVIQYHNGVYSIANNSLLKLSITHEALERGVKSSMQNFQNTPSNYLGNWNKIIFDSRYIAIPSLRSINDSSDERGVIEYLTDNGVQSMYMFPVEDSMGETFGIGVVEYVKKEHYLDSNKLHWTRSRFQGIGALLAGSEKD